jgi:hypothetical protein
MDPNAALTGIREVVAKTYTEDGANPDDTARLCELVEALDDWLTKGGFLPDAWTPASALGELDANDHILTRASRDLDGPTLPYSMCLALQLYPDTPIFVRLHKAEHRAVVQFGHLRAETALFADAPQIARLATLFTHVRHRLT